MNSGHNPQPGSKNAAQEPTSGAVQPMVRPDGPPGVLYRVEERIAYLTLNRPQRLNAIDTWLPSELAQAVARANADERVHVLVLGGAGAAFCSGYDLKEFAEKPGFHEGFQPMPWDPLVDYGFMSQCTSAFMSLWRSPKPVICQVHGYAVAGGSDIALCADLVVMADDAQIGYPPARLWGCPTTAMWLYRVGAERAKRLLLTGDLIDGQEAARIGLVSQAVPAAQLSAAVDGLARRMASVPKNQLQMQKMVINQAYENMGLATTQMLATLLDGVARHTPEGVAFKQRAEAVGFRQAVVERDSGQPLGGT